MNKKQDVIPSGSGVPEPTGEAPKPVEKQQEQVAAPEVKKEVNDETAKLKEELSNLQKVLGKQGQELGELRKKNETPAKKDEPKDYDALESNIVNKLDSGELDLKSALREMNKLATERGAKLATEQIRTEQNKQKSAEAVNAFKQTNPDYDKILESGELDNIIASNPLHDSFSAYYEYKNNVLMSEMETRLSDAKKAGEEEGLKIASESKNPSKVLGKQGTDIREKQTQPYGSRAETKSAMAEALQRMRSQ